MMITAKNTIGIILSFLFLFVVPVQADTDEASLESQAKQMENQAVGNGAVVVDKLSETFTDFAGSKDNAQALITGIRNGSEITITTEFDNVTSTATFTAPTRKTGYGNVFISLSLAQQQLADLGITQPTAEQIQIALLGGNINSDTTLPGILSLRASGMGWGEIAKSLGFKLGHVISSIRSANKRVRKEITQRTKINKMVREKVERPQKMEKPNRPEKPSRPEKIERPRKN